MDDRQTFKFAFLMAAARDGLSEDETKVAIADLEHVMRTEKRAAIEHLTNALKFVLSQGVPLAVGSAAVAGAGGGALAASLRSGTFNAESAKKQELIAAYNSFSDQADQMKRRDQNGSIRVPMNS